MTTQSTFPISSPVLTLSGVPLDWNTISLYLRRAGLLDVVFNAIQDQYLIQQALAETMITVDSVEIEKELLQRQSQNHMFETISQDEKKGSRGSVSHTSLDEIIYHLQVKKLMEKIVTPRLPQAYISKKLLLDQVILSRIVVAEKNEAEELYIQLVEEKASFTMLAQTYSLLSDTGQIICSRGKLPIVIRAAVDTADPNQIIGPLSVEGVWYLLRLEAIHSLSLKEAQEQLTEILFKEWLHNHRPSIDVPSALGDHHVFC
ncbi:peptidylprolyl isomerase [Acaryochloris sp. IP29b_bin.137]|uniref:peptidylprolyl isomerase n=1 Tax=Acaryochloris sp. IP29b_bin.137 TaxID=2969217 RepID=UPI0026306A70|nr:peptidylprolyl isomerase [Acaryochloris sp. IP29b_bin.137]